MILRYDGKAGLCPEVNPLLNKGGICFNSAKPYSRLAYHAP
jgi:hypothetical protein